MSALSPFNFQWAVPSTGFRIASMQPAGSGRAQPLRYVVAADDAAPHRVYEPLTMSGLFCDFAEVTPDDDGILAFANQHGFLGHTLSQAVAPKIRRGESVPITVGEQVSAWQEEIRHLKSALRVWRAVQARDSGYLSKIVVWRNSTSVRLCVDENRSWIANPDLNPHLLQRFPAGDLVGPTQYYIQKLINDKLETYPTTPRLLWFRQNAATSLRLFIVPQSLISAMWLQFAKAVDGNRDYRRCSQCQRWFELGGGVIRSDATYCSNACRQRRYRRERQQQHKRKGASHARKAR